MSKPTSAVQSVQFVGTGAPADLRACSAQAGAALSGAVSPLQRCRPPSCRSVDRLKDLGPDADEIHHRAFAGCHGMILIGNDGGGGMRTLFDSPTEAEGPDEKAQNLC